jgi:hypothetical protein
MDWLWWALKWLAIWTLVSIPCGLLFGRLFPPSRDDD